MTREEAVEALTRLEISNFRSGKSYITEAFVMAINALRTEPCEDCISRNDTRIIHTSGLEEGIRCAMCTNPIANDRGCDGGCDVNESMYKRVLDVIDKRLKALPSVQPKPKKGYISIADVMSVFDDFMCGEVDEDGTEIFLEMLKDKAESE